LRGKGLLLAIDLGRKSGPRVVAQAFERGLLINAPRRDSLRFMPALTVTHAEIDQMIGILDEVLEQMEEPPPATVSLCQPE
jgi:acetylornithine/N-succinyldiaminopimelate aminotransferase